MFRRMDKKIRSGIILCLIGITLLLLVQFTSGEPSSQYSKTYLTPFYRQSMTQNVIYNYTVSIEAPDRISRISSAIISFDVYMTPSVNFSIKVNGQNCNTQSYYIGTTFASAGQSRISFDCSNIIRTSGTYAMTLKSSLANTGAISGWIDIMYVNNPSGDVQVHGTEYYFGQVSKVWLQLLNGNGTYINDGICFADIYNPDMSQLVERATMISASHDGLYSYDLVLPESEGVYPAIALCYYTAGRDYKYATSLSMQNGSVTAGDVTRTYALDTSYLTTDETTAPQGNPRRYNATFLFNNGTVCSDVNELLLTGITIGWTGRWNGNPTADTMNIYIYNYTSASWLQFANNITGVGTGVKTVSNSFAFNNITKAGFINSSGTGLRLRFEDTIITDTSTTGFDYDYLYVSCDRLSSPVWQEVKGSSELHLNAPQNVTANLNITGMAVNYSLIEQISNASALDVKQNVSSEIGITNTKIDGITSYLSTLLYNIWTYPVRYVHGVID